MKNKILFICNNNTIRSPMAEGLFNAKMGWTPYKACSASINQNNIHHLVDPLAAGAMYEQGINISNHTPQYINDIDISEIALIITLSEAAYKTVQTLPSCQNMPLEHWALPEPPAANSEMNRETAMPFYRSLYQEIERRINNKFTSPAQQHPVLRTS